MCIENYLKENIRYDPDTGELWWCKQKTRGNKRDMAIAKDKVQEVLPYTISVKFVDDGTTYSYLASKDQFPVGFYLVKGYSQSSFQIAQVTAVDTKSNKATKEFAPIGKLAVDLY